MEKPTNGVTIRLRMRSEITVDRNPNEQYNETDHTDPMKPLGEMPEITRAGGGDLCAHEALLSINYLPLSGADDECSAKRICAASVSRRSISSCLSFSAL